MADYETKHVFATAAFLFPFFYLHFLSLLVAGDSLSVYNPIDNIAIKCGFVGNQYVQGDTRTWTGDGSSKFFHSDFNRNNASVSLKAQSQPTSEIYATARLSHSEFTYSVPVSPGQIFIRLHFYSDSYPNFDRSKAVFSVKVGLYYTLLLDFNASVNADASHSNQIVREFCVCVGNDEKLNLTFTSANQDSYAFISGIEIVSMPKYLYYTPDEPNDGGIAIRELKLIGQNNPFFRIDNYTSLEMLYRVHFGGHPILPVQDTGMFRTWDQDYNFLNGAVYDSRLVNTAIVLNYSLVPPYTAPKLVYQAAQTMGPNETLNESYNLTWEYPVDPGFFYMLRLHFCEIDPKINDINERMFLIYIGDMIAEENFDVFRYAGGKGIPYLKDYVVYVQDNNEKKVNLSVKLGPSLDEFKTRWKTALLNGIEIFKLNNSNGNLGGKNPDSPYISSPTQSSSLPSNTNGRVVTVVIIPVVVGGVVFMIVLGLFVFFSRRRIISMDQTSSDGTSWWVLQSISSKKSGKSHRSSNLPSDLCRYFTLAEIKAATKNFDEIFIIGIGGFGNVYKGYIDDGGTQVAIKRLKPSSKQGAREFKTEIDMLSQLRHVHLVSLIGYCNDGNEMILVYEYMSHGTLRSHLYGEDEQRLSWKQRLQICIEAARGLQYLHTGAKHTIIHRDIKTTNILLDEKWVAKVSDFGLSKVGPTNMSNDHISTVVKGTFGYLDPEYYRRQQLTEKSDVYSFGVVLCEVLCGRPPLMRLPDKKQTYLAEWVQRCAHNNTVTEIIDPKIKDEITPRCLKKFIEIAMSCIQDEGIKRPAMNDVVWSLEFALQLQVASEKKRGEDVVKGCGGDCEKDNAETCSTDVGDPTFSSIVDGKSWSKPVSSSDTTENTEDLGYPYSKETTGTVFSDIKEPTGR